MSPKLLPLDDAFECINALPAHRETEIVESSPMLSRRYLARDCVAQHDVPPFANSAVDGYALADPDVPELTVLPVSGRIEAGRPAPDIAEGTAVEIFTGAALPANARTVVMCEDTRVDDGALIRLHHRPKLGAHMRKAGEDFQAGTIIVQRGTFLTPRHIAALRIAGIQTIEVFSALRIGVFSGGDELQEEDGHLQTSAIRDSNRPSLIALLRHLGHEPVDLGIVRDNKQQMPDFLRQHCQDFDLLIGSAGMSESDTDRTIQAMQQFAKVLFWQLAIKPARPIGLAKISHDQGACYLLGLPGNPASCLLGAWLVGRGLISRLYGGKANMPKPHWVRIGFDFTKKIHRREFVRVQLEHLSPHSIAHRALPSGSATLSSMLKADGILDLPQGRTSFHKGDPVIFYAFPEFF